MLSDPEIQALIEDVKPLSSKVLKEIQLKNKENKAYKEYDLEVNMNFGAASRKNLSGKKSLDENHFGIKRKPRNLFHMNMRTLRT